ncbi:MAG TPA: hypothetical protein VFR31_15320 [Thermoanaerobaculia bacterium]|nr:hypothetical protein [Thermoanaerobaculia bacterium]
MPIRFALALLLLLSACVPKYAGLPERPPAAPPSVPVVFVPGVTGVVLRDSKTGEVVWGEGRNLLGPRDDGARLTLGPDDTLEPVAPIDQINLFGIHKPIYGPLRDLLIRAGYVEGRTLFFFAYDWRRDLIESAGRLRAQLEESGAPEVDLVCQSSGAHLCRYLAKYDLPQGIAIRKLVLVGASNGGSLRILRELDRGRRYVPLVGRFMGPEVVFTFPSLFQDLPIYRKDLFLDEEGRPMDVDLWDPESWDEYDWSVQGREDELARRLAEAHRFQEMLHEDSPRFGNTRIYVVGSTDQPTPDRAVLVRDGEEWKTFFTGDAWLSRRPVLEALATAEGDEHATTTSQDWLSPQEKAALALPPRRVEGGHFEALLTVEAGRFLLEALSP